MPDNIRAQHAKGRSEQRAARSAVTITNRARNVIHSGTTPLTATLRKGAVTSRKKTTPCVFSKDGFEPRELTHGNHERLVHRNILFGGLIGMLVVDPQTGAMYDSSRKPPDATPTPLKGLMPVEGSGLRIVALTDLPPDLLEQSRPIAFH